MSWLERSIGWVAPEWALRRARAAAALQMVRGYDGANRTRRTSQWRTSGASANAEVSSALSQLRNRARDLVRNNPYARRAISTLVGNAVGVGVTLGLDDIPGRVWKTWAAEADYFGDHDFYGLQALTARAGFESGDCLIVRVRTNAAGAGRSGVPLRIKVLEGDFLDTSKNGPMSGGNYAVGGVELNPEGRRVAFWIFPQHPGESATFNAKMESQRVLAEDVIYHFEKERPGQVLGVPRLASAIMRLRDLDEYQEALLVKKKIEACFAAFVASAEDNPLVGTTSETETDAEGNTRRVERFSPGQIIYGKPGEEITFGQPSSGSDMGFTADQLRAIAAGAGCTYEQITGDLSRVNYSSMRGGRAEYKILIEQYRWLTFIPQVCERVYGWWEEAAFIANKIRTRDYAHVWTPPRWEYVNPKEDVETKLLELKACLTSHAEALRERGEDPAAVLKEIAQINAELEKLGIKPDYGNTKAAAPNPDGGDPPQAKTE